MNYWKPRFWQSQDDGPATIARGSTKRLFCLVRDPWLCSTDWLVKYDTAQMLNINAKHASGRTGFIAYRTLAKFTCQHIQNLIWPPISSSLDHILCSPYPSANGYTKICASVVADQKHLMLLTHSTLPGLVPSPTTLREDKSGKFQNIYWLCRISSLEIR